MATGQLNERLSGDEQAQVLSYRRVVIVAAGIVLGLVLSIGLAESFSGTSGGWYLDLGITLAAAAAAIAALRFLPRSAAILIAALCLTLAVIATVGSGQSGRIVRQAEAFARGRPWCLVSAYATRPITSTSQLGFFSLNKVEGVPHLAIRVQNGNEVLKAHWSIRKQSMEPGWGTDVRPCKPQEDHGTALRTGRLKPAWMSAFWDRRDCA